MTCYLVEQDASLHTMKTKWCEIDLCMYIYKYYINVTYELKLRHSHKGVMHNCAGQARVLEPKL